MSNFADFLSDANTSQKVMEEKKSANKVYVQQRHKCSIMRAKKANENADVISVNDLNMQMMYIDELKGRVNYEQFKALSDEFKRQEIPLDILMKVQQDTHQVEHLCKYLGTNNIILRDAIELYAALNKLNELESVRDAA